MKIVKAEIIVTSPDRNFVSLKITTEEGLTGLGDATLNGRELAVVATSGITSLPSSSAKILAASKTPGSSYTAARTGAAAR